jgi:hypothetical protein
MSWRKAYCCPPFRDTALCLRRYTAIFIKFLRPSLPNPAVMNVVRSLARINVLLGAAEGRHATICAETAETERF